MAQLLPVGRSKVSESEKSPVFFVEFTRKLIAFDSIYGYFQDVWLGLLACWRAVD
jgi:hypothetical protein